MMLPALVTVSVNQANVVPASIPTHNTTESAAAMTALFVPFALILSPFSLSVPHRERAGNSVFCTCIITPHPREVKYVRNNYV